MRAPQQSKLSARLGDCFLRAQQALPLRDQYQLEVGWARLSRVMSLAPIISLDFSRSNARGRSDLHRPKRRMDVPSTYFPRNTARLARQERSVVAVSSERRLFASQRPTLGGSGPADLLRPADGRDWPAACEIMHRRSRSARRRACSAGRLTGRPRYSARRAKVGFGQNCRFRSYRRRRARACP